MAQNHFMAVGSLAAAKSMANPQFEAWRQKVIRYVATAPVDKHNSSYWEELISKETDKEMDEILREREQAKEMRCARPCTLTKRQQRTAAQAASDAAERAEAALRRVEKGWRAPRLGGTPLGVWHAECWEDWAQRLDDLGTQAELYAVGKGGTEEARQLMMRRLKNMTCATEKLVGVQRSALTRRAGVEQAWRRWLCGNGWGDCASTTTGSDEYRLNPMVGRPNWAARLRGAEVATDRGRRLEEGWEEVRLLSKGWKAGEELAEWWGDREQAYATKVQRARVAAEEELYRGEGQMNETTRAADKLLHEISR